jgi:hypothetical protein
MIPIKNFKSKTPYLAKVATDLNKHATLVKNFKMPVIAMIAGKSRKRKKKK